MTVVGYNETLNPLNPQTLAFILEGCPQTPKLSLESCRAPSWNLGRFVMPGVYGYLDSGFRACG